MPDETDGQEAGFDNEDAVADEATEDSDEDEGAEDSDNDADDSDADGSDSGEEDDFDPRAEVTSLRTQVAAMNDLLDAQRRQLGQVKGLQSKLDKVEQALANPRGIRTLSAKVDALVEAMGEDMPAATLNRINELNAEGRQEEAVELAVKQVRTELNIPDETADPTPATTGEEATASRRVYDYAEGKGISEAELVTLVPHAEWVAAQQEAPTLEGAVRILKRKIDAAVKARTDSTERVATKKAAAKKAKTPAKSGSGKILPTKAQLAAMTVEEVMKITPEDRAKIIRNG
jgi:hypothetical protein